MHFTAAIRVLVDGGANRFFKYMEENHLTDALEGPSYACGDLDSITEESIKRLTEMNVEIIHTPDQDHTDLTKSLLVSKPFMDKLNVNVFFSTIFHEIKKNIHAICDLFLFIWCTCASFIISIRL